MQCSSCDLAFLHPAYPHTPSAISDHIVSEMGAKRPSLKSFINKPLRQFEGQLHPLIQRVECAGQYSNAGAPGLSVGRHSSEPSISWISSVENTFKTASIILRLLNTNFSPVDQHYGLLGGWDAVD